MLHKQVVKYNDWSMFYIIGIFFNLKKNYICLRTKSPPSIKKIYFLITNITKMINFLKLWLIDIQYLFLLDC